MQKKTAQKWKHRVLSHTFVSTNVQVRNLRIKKKRPPAREEDETLLIRNRMEEEEEEEERENKEWSR